MGGSAGAELGGIDGRGNCREELMGGSAGAELGGIDGSERWRGA